MLKLAASEECFNWLQGLNKCAQQHSSAALSKLLGLLGHHEDPSFNLSKQYK